jgi:hypothetical protein
MMAQVGGSMRALAAALSHRIMPVVHRWWMNPLLRHARRSAPLSPSVIRLVVPGLALLLLLISLLAWALNLRAPGAIVMALSVGAVALPVMVAPLVSAHRVAAQMENPQHDPRQLTDLDPREVAWGLSLVTMWQLRWLIALALAAVPALMIGVLHISTADFQVWRDSAQLLSDTGNRASYLSASGGIPYFRLMLQCLSVGLLPWVLLPLMASLGVLVALQLEDVLVSDLAAIVIAMMAGSLILLVWILLSRVVLLAGSFEIVRGILLLMFMATIGFMIRSLTIWSGNLLDREIDEH